MKKLALLSWLCMPVALFSQDLVQQIRGRVVDRESRLPLQGAFISLTRSERDLLRELMQANGNLCSRRQLARAMSSSLESTSEETVTVLIYRLRKKLEAAGIPGPLIETIAGAGYRFAGAG